MNSFPKRKEIRMKEFDYTSNGAYFITICTKDRQAIFWESNQKLHTTENISLSQLGILVSQELETLNSIYSTVSLSKWCIMPDHIHMILELHAPLGERAPKLSQIINQFKGAVSRKAGKSIWQSRYYDHAIRNNEDYRDIWQYIENNPLKYLLDKD